MKCFVWSERINLLNEQTSPRDSDGLTLGMIGQQTLICSLLLLLILSIKLVNSQVARMAAIFGKCHSDLCSSCCWLIQLNTEQCFIFSTIDSARSFSSLSYLRQAVSLSSKNISFSWILFRWSSISDCMAWYWCIDEGRWSDLN